MKSIEWNPVKSERLKRTRGVSFEEILKAEIVAVKEHPTNDKQKMMIFDYKNYINI